MYNICTYICIYNKYIYIWPQRETPNRGSLLARQGSTQETPRRHPKSTREARSTQEAPRRHPGGTQEAPRRHPGGTQEAPRGTQGTQEAPGGLGSKKVTKPLCFTIESGASDHFACTRRARPSPSTVNYSKNERRYARTFPRTLHSPF